MGLTTWKNPEGKILMSDVVISKNYLKENELDTLNRVVEGFLNIAELRANQNILMSMNDWKEILNSYIKLNQLPILTHKGKINAVSHELTQNCFVFCLVSCSYAFDITVSKHIYQTIKLLFFTYFIIG